MLSFSTLTGVVFGVAIFCWAVLSATTNWKIFLSPPSAAIVVGGTITSAFIGYRWRYIKNALSNIFRIFVRQAITPRSLVKDVGMVIEWADKVKAEGSAAWEAIASETKSDFIKNLAELISTGYSPKEVHIFCETNIEENYYRHLSEANILNTMASASPAFGMVGTLIGLIVMLSKMEDPSQMGPGLSLALMTTLYGVVVARFIFQPTSTKVKQLLGIQRFREYLLLEGALLIMDKRSPFYIQDRLNSFLDRKRRFNIEMQS